MRVYVKGFGCSSSLADAEVLAGCLLSAGYAIVDNLQQADLVIYNTCAVKAPTENRMINLLKQVPKEKRLIVAGCLPLINFERLSKEVPFDGIVGPALGEEIVDVVKQVSMDMCVTKLENTQRNMPRLNLPRMRVNSKISIVPISYGCLGSCAYCCVRFARGNLRSYSVKEILNKVKRDLAEGICEFWLTSQDTACYGRDIGADLTELVKSLCSIEESFFIRVGMMTPNNILDILDELLKAFQSEKIFKFLHLPVQSGDDSILGKMNRCYSTRDFVMIVEKFREAFPQSTIATDIIVGFPGESEEAFKRSWKLIEEIKPDIVNISKFFTRPRTSAGNLKPQVSPLEVKQRSACLAGLVRRIAFERNSDWKGWSGKILVDEMGKSGSVIGRNFAYKPIVLRSNNGQDLLGQLVAVKVVDVFQSHLLGKIV